MYIYLSVRFSLTPLSKLIFIQNLKLCIDTGFTPWGWWSLRVMLPEGDGPSSALVNRPKAGLPACKYNHWNDQWEYLKNVMDTNGVSRWIRKISGHRIYDLVLQLIVSQLLFTFSSTNSAYQAHCLILISSKFSLTWRMHCLASIAISFWNEQYHGTVGGL